MRTEKGQNYYTRRELRDRYEIKEGEIDRMVLAGIICRVNLPGENTAYFPESQFSRFERAIEIRNEYGDASVGWQTIASEIPSTKPE